MKIFISYAHVDEKKMLELVDILRDADHIPWFDRHLVVGRDWEKQILDAIHDNDIFLYLLTPKSIQSGSCQWEFSQAVHACKPVVTILMQKIDVIPKPLAKIQYADFSNGAQGRAVAKLLKGIQVADCVSPDDVPLLSEPPEMPKYQVELKEPSWVFCRNKYREAHELFRKKNFTEAQQLLYECLWVDPQYYEAQQLLLLVKRHLSIPVTDILSEPFEWVEIPTGSVTLENTKPVGGSAGGEYAVPGFWIAKYPTTSEQYQVFVEQGYDDPEWWDYSDEMREWWCTWRAVGPSFEGKDLPRTMISWYEALAFACWLKDKTRLNITLPTEQQWQRAAQGDDRRKYPWGNEFDANRCNMNTSRSTPVTQYQNGVSPFGVMDMSGNVWEWCLTSWGNDGTQGSAQCVARGGSWQKETIWNQKKQKNETIFPDITTRHYRFFPYQRHPDLGFRLVCMPDPNH